ncbi:MAG TPA: Abi family protein [Steroidobacteraceae bacterium]|nr:Abi family protein [Steroidobacteraceae bacterium]
MKFAKPPLSFAEQLGKLKTRGMIVANDDLASQWLKSVSYYRLSAYCLPFKQPDGNYLPGSDFESVRMLYGFDRKLRLLLLDAIERIEVALRTAVTYQIAMKYGPFGYCDARNFHKDFNHDRLMKEIAEKEKDSTETFVKHFRGKYRSEPHFPVWMASELMSLGTISRIYRALHPDVRRTIATQLNTTDYHMRSWAHTLSYVRNLCAHHCRVWNRQLAIRPKLPDLSASWPYKIEAEGSIYSVLIIAHHILRKIAPHATWTSRVMELINQYPLVPIASLGLPSNWKDTNPWVSATIAAPKPVGVVESPSASEPVR